MRQEREYQMPLSACWPNQKIAKELEVISRILDDNPIIAEKAFQDLTRGKRTDVGAKGMTGDRVVRCTILKRLYGYSYEQLAFHIVDSKSFSRFVGLEFGEEIKKSTLQEKMTERGTLVLKQFKFS